MRPSSIALAACLVTAPLAGCKKDEAAVSEHKVAPPRPQIKRPVDTTPLPALAVDQRGHGKPGHGGATGKPLWAIGFGGLGIDSPRAAATAPGGDVYFVGYFDGEIDLGPAGKHRATENARIRRRPAATPRGRSAATARSRGKTFGPAATTSPTASRRAATWWWSSASSTSLTSAVPTRDGLMTFVAALDRAGEPQWL
jgi:hypothetical protein